MTNLPQPVAEFDTVVIGAGPCGLGAAHRFDDWNRQRPDRCHDYVVVDSRTSPGGAAASVVTAEGFTFDHGGHVLFPHQHDRVNFAEIVSNAVPAWSASPPVRGAILHGRFVPAPVQRNIHRLPLRMFSAGVWGLLTRRAPRPVRGDLDGADLQSYLLTHFGAGLLKHVLGPMNRKMWALELNALDSCWVRHCSGSPRPNVADVKLGKLLLNFILNNDDPGWQRNTRVSYPARGGTGAIWLGVANKLAPGRLLTGVGVIRIWSGAKRLELADGRIWRYRHLISSAPLDMLLDMIVDRPDLARHRSSLRRSSCALIGFGVRGRAPTWLDSVHGLHVPQANVPFWRVSFPGNMSSGNVPDCCHWSVLCEVSAAAELGEPDLDCLTRKALEGLIRLNILPKAPEIVSRWTTWLKHGYPVPFLGRATVLAQILPALKALGILSRGRFGAWIYEASNQDHAFFQGVEAADYVLDGRNESLFGS